MVKRNFFKHCYNGNQIIINGRTQKPAVNFNHWHYHTCGFHIFIGYTEASQGFRSPDFIKLGIVAMIYNPHLIGKGIVNSYLIFESKQLLIL